MSYCVKKNYHYKDSAAVPTVCLFWFDAASGIFGYLILGVGIDTMQYQGKLDLFTGAHWAQKFGPYGTGILGVGIDTVELSVTVLSITFKKGFGLKGWYLSTRPRTAAEMNNPSTLFALLSNVMKHYS